MPYIPQKKRTEPLWEPIFHPNSWKAEHSEQTIDNTKLTMYQLKMLGKQLTDMRAE
jgi:hypothetical protein